MTAVKYHHGEFLLGRNTVNGSGGLADGHGCGSICVCVVEMAVASLDLFFFVRSSAEDHDAADLKHGTFGGRVRRHGRKPAEAKRTPSAPRSKKK